MTRKKLPVALGFPGIVSTGKSYCAMPESPGIYTRVNKYLHWLDVNTKDACRCDEH